MGIAGNGPVVAPPLAPPRVGLIASAREINRLEEGVTTEGTRWETGFAWDPEGGCDAIGIEDPCDPNPGKVPGANPALREYDPVVLWAGDKCTSRGVRDRPARARRRLIAGQSKKLAQELWNGTLAIGRGFPNAYLSNLVASNTITNGALGEAHALACLEDGLANCSISGTGMIHATPGLMAQWYGMRLVERFGNVFRTANDTLVVADAGYTGEGPGGVSAIDGSVWAYATDLIFVRLGAIEVFPKPGGEPSEAMAFNPPDNSLRFIAERMAAATWDGCCHLAAEVDTSACASLAAS